MCFGNSTQQQSTTTNSSYTPSPYLTSAAQSNLGFAQNLQNQGFTPYQGQMVANFSPQQQAAFGQGSGIAGAVTPAMQLAGTGLQSYLTSTGTPSAPVTANTISSMMSPYMNNYVNMALQPQLEAQNQQFAQQNKSWDSASTGSGAFGDTSWALGRGNLTNQQDIARMGLVGQAYNSAFNTAIGAGAQDVANNLNAQIASRNLALQQQNAQLAGISTAYGENVGSANLQDVFGNQQTANDQARLNAMYNQYLMGLQYPFQTTGLVNQTIGAAVPASPSKGTSASTTYAPDNSGFGILGSLIGAGGSAASGALQGGIGDALGVMMLAADGGDVPAGAPTLVGERGPEVIVPKGNSNVIPYHKLKKAIAQKRGVRQTDGLAAQLGAAA